MIDKIETLETELLRSKINKLLLENATMRQMLMQYRDDLLYIPDNASTKRRLTMIEKFLGGSNG